MATNIVSKLETMISIGGDVADDLESAYAPSWMTNQLHEIIGKLKDLQDDAKEIK